MDFHLLLPGEAASLLGVSVARITELIDSGQLGAFRDHERWWIPLQCLAMYAGDDFKVDPACALAVLVGEGDGLIRTFDDHPEAAERIQNSEFAAGTVGACLKQALIMYRRSRDGAPDSSPNG